MASNLLPMLPVYSVTYPAGSYRSTAFPLPVILFPIINLRRRASAPPNRGRTQRRRALAPYPVELCARELAMTPASRQAIRASGARAPRRQWGSVADVLGDGRRQYLFVFLTGR